MKGIAGDRLEREDHDLTVHKLVVLAEINGAKLARKAGKRLTALDPLPPYPISPLSCISNRNAVPRKIPEGTLSCLFLPI
jgi:hypothetical protein